MAPSNQKGQGSTVLGGRSKPWLMGKCSALSEKNLKRYSLKMVNSQRSEPAGKRLSTMDDRVLGAAVELLAEEGYSALAFTRISERAGLSRRPVHDRYANRGDIALDIWNQVASGALIAALQSLYDSYEGADASREHFVEQMQNFFSPSEELHCALEILVVSQFDLCLSTAISESAVRDFEPLIHRGSNDAELRKATKRAYVTAFALGLALTSRMPASEPIDIGFDAGRLFDSLLLDAEQLPMPDVEGSLFAQPIPIETGDVQLDALLTAALDEIALQGFEKATTVRIARAAGCSEGFLFSRFNSKRELFVDAVRRKSTARLQRNNELLSKVASTHGQPTADALLIRESMRPEAARRRSLNLEHLRVGMHDADMRRAQSESLEKFVRDVREQDADWARLMTLSRARFSYAVGMGVSAVPLLMPSAWDLPFDVTTRAFAE